jgi:hypothetical protein
MRGLWAEVWMEKAARAAEEADAACDDASDSYQGPYRVGPVRGMH